MMSLGFILNCGEFMKNLLILIMLLFSAHFLTGGLVRMIFKKVDRRWLSVCISIPATLLLLARNLGHFVREGGAENLLQVIFVVVYFCFFYSLALSGIKTFDAYKLGAAEGSRSAH